MNGTASYTTIAIVFVIACLIFGPPQSRWGFLLACVVASTLSVFATLASGLVTGVEAVDSIVNNMPVGMR